MSKFDPIEAYLREQTDETVTLTFAQLEAMVKLPAAAKRYEFWWSNEDVKSTVHVQCLAWQNAGYEARPNLRGKRILFRRRPDDDAAR